MTTGKSYNEEFVTEALEALENLEADLIALDHARTDKAIIQKVFRVMHTLKGSGGMFGFVHLSDLAHRLENIYDLIRDEIVALDDLILEVSLKSIDHFRLLIRDQKVTSRPLAKSHDDLIEAVENILFNLPKTKTNSPHENRTKNPECWIHIHYKPAAGSFQSGSQPIFTVLDCLSAGAATAIVDISELPELPALNPELSYLSWDIVLRTTAKADDVRDLFLFIDEGGIAEVTEIPAQKGLKSTLFQQFLTEKQQACLGCRLEEILAFLVEFSQTEIKSEPEIASEKPAEADVIAASIPEKKEQINSIRVDVSKLDTLVSLVSELVTVQARLSLLAEKIAQPELLSANEEIEKISRRLRENTFSISMIPLNSLETRFNRLVHDLAASVGKKVDLKTEGLDTELDRSLIERIVPPLLHIFRNSIDHGIEKADVREASGKLATGTITLRAFYSGANVVIEVEDDGAGVDLDRVRAKAIKNGLISAEANLSKKELLDLLFMPGFSTREKVTEVSGRGVGMDVVRTAMNDLRGEVSIQSHLGKGTVMTLRLPLTLSILDGLLVSLSNQKYIIPLQFIDKCYEVPFQNDEMRLEDVIVVDNAQLPVIDLRLVFDNRGKRPALSSVVVVHFAGQRCGLVVDYVIGEHQAVLKSLGKVFAKVKAVSGGTILGDGEIALILDVNRIVSEFVTVNQKEEVAS